MTPFMNSKSEKPRMFEIQRIVTEARDIKTFWFRGDIGAKPGQFVMLWLPAIGQKPFGISYQEKGMFAVTVRKVGTFTGQLFKKKAKQLVGIQGPYGRPFSGEGKRVALVGGGYGTSPLGFLADVMVKGGSEVFFIIGAASADQILFRDRFKNKKVEMIFSTDDGSFGRHGLCTDCLNELLSTEKIDYVYCCGPEVMMQKVFSICLDKKLPGEFCLERYLKCGFGVCGSCCLDGTGWRVCKEGPVFHADELKRVTEFGKYKRDGSGQRVKI
jgi:dihydroorotate dehydrogenase electron transfer subunit